MKKCNRKTFVFNERALRLIESIEYCIVNIGTLLSEAFSC